MADSLGARCEVALGALLARRTRADLYGPATAGLAERGVDAATYPVLSGVARFGPISAARLAPLVGLERSVASRYAARLEASGLLHKTADTQDRRATLIALTADGERVVAVMRRQLAVELDARMSAWPSDVAAAFVEGLERFVGDPVATDGTDVSP